MFQDQVYDRQPNPPFVCGLDPCGDGEVCWENRCVPDQFAPNESYDVDPSLVEVAGGGARWELEHSVELRSDQDGWVVVRVRGVTPLFPLIPGQVGWEDGARPISEPPTRGVPALAMTNPIYVDVGGDGWRPPMAPGN